MTKLHLVQYKLKPECVAENELRWCEDGRLAHIRDFRYVPYIAQDASFELMTGAGP